MTSATYQLNRERVLRICAEQFAKTGYHGTGIADLSREVGLGRGALYHYIGSKETLLYEISREQVERMNAYAESVLRQDLPVEERLRELARGLLSNIAEHRAEWTVFFREYGALTGERRDRVIAARERYEGAWRQLIDEGVRSGVLVDVPSLLVKGILGMFNYTYLWYEPDGKVTPAELADLFLGTLLDGIRAGRRRRR